MKDKIQQGSFLVTGGAGFIGSHIVERLLKDGARKVRVFDDLSTGNESNVDLFRSNPAFEFLHGDIRNAEDCRKACEGIDYVLHQAALGSVPRSIKDPITTNAVNIDGFLNMLIASQENKVKRFVYAASSSTYGDSKALPKVEANIGKPLSPYAVTKYVNELYADVFARTYGLDTVGLRYFNVFGPRQDPKGAYAAVIPLFMDALINGKAPVINGDGEQTRDFTYVDNAVQANLLALFTEKPEAVNQVYNVACGERTSLNQLYNSLKELAGSAIDAQHGPSRAGDIQDSLADVSKASSLLGYEPLVYMKAGLAQTFQWFKNTYHPAL